MNEIARINRHTPIQPNTLPIAYPIINAPISANILTHLSCVNAYVLNVPGMQTGFQFGASHLLTHMGAEQCSVDYDRPNFETVRLGCFYFDY